VVSDAGTPAFSDPGLEVVKAAVAAGVPVIPIPGANAALSALVASGMDTIASSMQVSWQPSRAHAELSWKLWLQRQAA